MRAFACYDTASVGERIASAYPPDGGTNQRHAYFNAINGAFFSAALQTQTASRRVGTDNLCNAIRGRSTAFSVKTDCPRINTTRATTASAD
jgi:hypothetical protein